MAYRRHLDLSGLPEPVRRAATGRHVDPRAVKHALIDAGMEHGSRKRARAICDSVHSIRSQRAVARDSQLHYDRLARRKPGQALLRMQRKKEQAELRAASAELAAVERAREERRERRAAERASERERCRANLLLAARIARKLGATVRSSKGRDGRISSYYARLPYDMTAARVEFGRFRGLPPQVRISDHLIPCTDRREREFEARGMGSYAGYEEGPQVLVDGTESCLRLERWLTLALHGRDCQFLRDAWDERSLSDAWELGFHDW